MSDHPSRRAFLFESAGWAVFLPTAAATLTEFSTAIGAEALSTESYWQKVREQFPFRESKVPMNAANLCPSPRLALPVWIRWLISIGTPEGLNSGM